MRLRGACAAALVLALAACGGETTITEQAPGPANAAIGYGPNPELPAPHAQIAPTVKVADAVGWPDGAAPIAPEGFSVTRFAEGLDHPRWLYVLPNGDVLAAQASTPRVRGRGFVGWIRNKILQRAGAAGDGPGHITLLRDADGDGIAETRSDFATDLFFPFGMALLDGWFYIGETNAVVRYRYTDGALRLMGEREVVLELPYHEGDNGHWTRDLIVSPDGEKLYVSVGSVSNIGDQGMAIEEGRAAIWEFNPDGSQVRVFASGLRNPVGLDFEPRTGALWTAVNERDMLGDDLVPDYITSVREGGFYGWPYSYFGRNVDARVEPQSPDLVARAIAPDFAMGAHTASLSVHFYTAEALPARYRGGAFVGQHGSWNRSPLVGYKVAFVPFENGKPAGAVEDFLTGFLTVSGQAMGRPVGVATDLSGAILVADDVGDIIWRVAPTG